MITISHFESALPYAEFMQKFGSASDQANWDSQKQRHQISDHQKQLLQIFTRKTKILILAGAWCGDCAAQCTILEKFAEIAPCLEIRYHDRDEQPELQKELQINGGHRVPVAVLFSEDGFEVQRYGEKPLSEYRKKVVGLVPANLLNAPNQESSSNVSDWLGVIERVQWILRTSPRLRRLHAD